MKVEMDCPHCGKPVVLVLFAPVDEIAEPILQSCPATCDCGKRHECLGDLYHREPHDFLCPGWGTFPRVADEPEPV
jgi:hypothetical protein